MNKNNEKVKIKTKNGSKLTPVTMTVVSLGALLLMFSIGVYPELMGNSVTKESYTIVYNSNGGSGSMKNQIIKSDVVTELKRNKFKKDGYTFVGWRAYRSDGLWDCYIDNNKSLTSWTVQSYCSKYGYSLYKDGVYVQNLVNSGMKLTLYAEWQKN